MSFSQRRHWVWIIVGIILAHIPGNVGTGRPIGAVCLYTVANATETTVGAMILTRLGRERVTFSSVHQLLRLFIVAIPANALIAFLLAGPVVYFHFAANFWYFWRLWFVADGLGILLVTPVILSSLGGDCRHLTPLRLVETACILLASAFLGLWIFHGSAPAMAIAKDLPMVFTIPLIIWAAIRLNVTVTSLTALVFAAIAVLETVAGHGPFVDHSSSLQGVLVSLQVAVMAWATCGLVISVAIAQNRDALQLLTDREDLFRLLATNSPAAIFQFNAAGKCIYMNQQWQTITGQSITDALGLGWADTLHPDDRLRVGDEWRRAVESASEYVGEYRICRPSGEIRWINARLSALPFRQNAPSGYVGIGIDVTNRKRIEEELEDRRRFHVLVADLSATLVDADADEVDQAVRDALVKLAESLDIDRISLAQRSADNQKLHIIFGHVRVGPQFEPAMRMDTMHPWTWKRLSAGETVGFEKLDELPSEAAVDKASWIERSIKSLLLIPISIGGTEQFTFGAAIVGRERKFSAEFAQRFRVLGETFANAIVRAAADRDLRQNEGMLRQLNVELSRTEDRERRRLAALLHDDLAQSIFGATAQLVALRRQGTSGSQTQPLDSVISTLDQALTKTRELTYELCPPVLYEQGLVAALSKLCEQLSQHHGLVCRVETVDGEHRLDVELAGLIYQAVRELLMNVVKHAHASRADVRLEQSADQLSITVADDGGGIASKGVRYLPCGFGLFNIRQRLTALGGRLEITSSPGAGCTVRLLLPSIPQSPVDRE